MTMKHNKTNWFLKKELLIDVTKFSQFEKRISKLPTDKEKGDALEVFAEAWLSLDPVLKAEEVWPFEQIPSKVKHKLGLDTKKDMGVDGLFRTADGESIAYQVKFRTGRPTLTWREMSTFTGLAGKTDRKLVFTNCEKLPTVVENMDDVLSVRGVGLDELEQKDFERILAWLKTGRVKPEPKREPREDQLEALAAIEESFKDKREKRATAVMACGTGKTVTALWAAERLGYKKILVLVPSLALLSQTLQEWMKETSWEKVSYICVCSDPTVNRGADNWEVRQSDLPFPVGTDSAAVEEFMTKRTGGVKIVFSTYQSAPVVAEGLNGRQFDFGVFDEAHKTAGRQGTKFAFALSDENLPIRRRLFLTATPRHYNVYKKNKEGDAELIYSMNDENVYGRRVYELPFAEAAKKGIICGYKVLISVVTSEEVDEEFLSKGEVLVQGDEIKARQVANQLALKRAVEKFPVKKAFTFHSFVKSAMSFTSDKSEGLKTHLPEFETFHVSGAMPVSEREMLLREFRESKKSVMSNARCLTEGVNVPVVDMVAFMSPKKSRVDIVQATGRAMRKAGRKKKGYVLIPLFLQKAKDESIEDALERTDFGEVWDVLQAMSEQDEALAEIISQAVFEKAKTKAKSYDDQKFKERAEVLGRAVSLEQLERTVTARCIEKLGVSWDERYGELVAYKECTAPGFLDTTLRPA
jgi:predicted helicase